MMHLIWPVTAGVAVFLAAFGFGRPLVRICGNRSISGGLNQAVFSIAGGIAITSAALAGIGFLGWLSEPLIDAITLSGCGWAAIELAWARLIAISPIVVDIGRADALREIGVTRQMLLACAWALLAAGIAGGAALVSALCPPLSPEALAGLNVVKNWLFEGGPSSLAGAELSHSSVLATAFYLWPLALAGPLAVNVVQWGCGLLLALVAGLLAQRLLCTNKWPIASALVLVTPGVCFAMSAPSAELPMAVFAGAAFLAWTDAMAGSETRGRSVYAALMALMAACLHPAGLLWVAVVAALWAYAARERLARRPALLFAVGCSSAAALGLASWYALHRPVGALSAADPQTMAHLGCLALAGLPLVLLLRCPFALKPLLLGCALYAALAMSLFADARWWSPLAVPCAVMVTWIWLELETWPLMAARCCRWAFAALALVAAGTSLRALPSRLPVALGWQTHEEYVSAHNVDAAIAVMANQILNPADRVLSEGVDGFYFCCPVSDERAVRQSEEHRDLSASQINRGLARRGFTYVLLVDELAPESCPGARADDSSLARLAVGASQPGGNAAPAPFLQTCLKVGGSPLRRYRLIRLPGDGLPVPEPPVDVASRPRVTR